MTRHKWITFTTAPDQITAEMWRDLVRQAGIACELQPGDTISFIGISAAPVRLIAREPDVEGAKRALDDQLGRGSPQSRTGTDWRDATEPPG